MRGCIASALCCASAPIYGAVSDSTPRVPLLYDTFMPPAAGQVYADPVFGTLIKRISQATNMFNQAVAGPLSFVSTEYSTASPFNSNTSLLILQHAGYFGLYDAGGTYLKDLPFAANAATEPRWSRTDPNVLFYLSGNRLMKLNVATGTSSLVHAFPEYTTIRGRGESDISRDGDHFVLSGDEPAGLQSRYVFVYQISTDTKGPVLDTIGHPFNQLYLAPNNMVAIGWIAAGTARFTGIELFDRSMTFQRQLTRAIGHMRLTRDTNGEDVLVWANSNDVQPIPNCQNGIVRVRLSDAHQTCLLQLDWSLAVHITAGDGDGWVFVETYDPSDAPATAAWKPYANEILQVRLDGKETRRLLHHRSRQTANYGYQPRLSASRDGSTLVYTSNYNLQSLLGLPAGYTDAFLVAVPGTPAPQISIDDRTIVEGSAGTAPVAFTVALSHVSEVPVTVRFQTVDGSAKAGKDFAGVSGLLTIPALSTSKRVIVLIQGDTELEGDNTFTVALADSVGASIAKAVGTGTIVNDDPTVAARAVTQYRLYHRGTLEHLYTADLNEYNILGTRQWIQEGVAYKMLTDGFYNGIPTIPLFRLYHPGILQHHWTTDSYEATFLWQTDAWAYEGIVGYVLPLPVIGATPLYRLALANPPLHLWTINLNEYTTLATRGWVKEGIVGYVIP